MNIGNTDFVLGKRTYIMGILNVTPDSFSDGGKYTNVDAAVAHASQMLEEGADIIDIGGESTRPGYLKVSVEEEIKRVVSTISAVHKAFKDVPISVDTYKPDVCRAAIEAGASFINDIWGFKYNKDMAVIAAKYNLPVCLMHNRNNTEYKDFMEDLLTDLSESIAIAIDNGVNPKNIILDPGIGFGKTYEQNIIAIKNLDKIKERFNLPILLGTSRKSVIGKALGGIDVSKRCEGTVATSVIGIEKGCDFIRVHDIKENKRACMMADAILRQ